MKDEYVCFNFSDVPAVSVFLELCYRIAKLDYVFETTRILVVALILWKINLVYKLRLFITFSLRNGSMGKANMYSHEPFVI